MISPRAIKRIVAFLSFNQGGKNDVAIAALEGYFQKKFQFTMTAAA